MKFPSLKISIPLIFLIWCIVGVQVHGWVMLAYPAMWGAVGLVFLVLHLALKANSGGPSANGSSGSSG